MWISLSKEYDSIQLLLQGPAVVNLRHRRSRSQGGDKWVDHRPTQVASTNVPIAHPLFTHNLTFSFHKSLHNLI